MNPALPGNPVQPDASTAHLDAEVKKVLAKLTPGAKLRITHLIRIGMQSWTATVTGTFRHLDSLATGLATQRVPEDDIIVPILHFTKDPHGELSSVALDEHTRVEIL